MILYRHRACDKHYRIFPGGQSITPHTFSATYGGSRPALRTALVGRVLTRLAGYRADTDSAALDHYGRELDLSLSRPLWKDWTGMV